MSDREELDALRRMAELSAKEGGISTTNVAKQRMAEEDKRLYSPTVGMPTGERLTAGYGGAMPELYRGSKQLLTEGLIDPFNRLGVGLPQLITQNEVTQAKSLDKPLLDTAAGMTGRTLGLAIPAASTAMIPGANTIGGSSLIGAGMGALTPTNADESRLGNMAGFGIAGGAGAGLARGGPILLNSLIAPFRQGGRENIVGRTLLRAAGDKADEVINSASAPSLIPGSKPSLAEASQDAGIAGFQLAASSLSPDIKRQLSLRSGENVAARVAALRGIAGDSGDMANMRGVRSMMTELPYKQALDTPIDAATAKSMAPQIDSLMRRPAMQTAVKKASEIFSEEDMALIKEGSPKGLQLAKQALDDLIEKAGSASSSIGKNQLRALQQTRSDLISTMETLTPKLREADAAYKTWSQPINQMQVGQHLLNKMQPALMDFTEGVPTRLRADSYAQAMRDAPQTVKTATGLGFPSLEAIMSPSQMNTLTGVGKDLARKATAEDLAKTIGPTTAQNLAGQNLISSFLGPLGLPQSWAERVAGSSVGAPVARFGNLAYSGAEQKIQGILGQALADPVYAAQLMRAARDGKIQNPLLMRGLLSLQQGAAMTPAGMLGAAP